MTDAIAIGAATYSGLEAAFLQSLRALMDRPAGSVWVLVPTNLVALHLKRCAARELGGVAGVEFLTLQDAARRAILPGLAEGGARPLPPGAAELFLKRQLEQAPPTSYFAALRQFPNGASAIERAIRTLEDCLWTPEALAEAARAAARSDDPGAPRRLRELAGMWAGLRAWKQEAGLFDEADLVREAGRQARPLAHHPAVLCVYGFYDLNPAQRSLVRRLADAATERRLFALWAEKAGRPEPGFEYAGHTIVWLRDLMRAGQIETASRPDTGRDLDRLVDGAFGERALPPADEARGRLQAAGPCFDGSVRVVNCPGEAAEAAEVVREVLRAAGGADGPASIGVLLRGGESTAGLLAEAFARAGVPCYLREGLPLSETPAGRVVLALLDLAVGDAERADVVDFLSLAEVPWPAGLSASAVDRMARQAGVVRGRQSWLRGLAARAERLRRDSEAAEDEAEAHALSREAGLCLTAVGLLGGLFDALRPLSSASSWAEASRVLCELTAAYAPREHEGTEPVREAVEQLGRLDVAGAAVSPQQVRSMLVRRLGHQSLRRARFQHTAATVSGVMDARGATFDVVIVPAMVEKNFPRPPSPQPLLTEADREALNGLAGGLGCGELPLQRHRPDEERHLFRIALASARRTLVLTYSRLEQDTGRPRLPSRFLVEACSAVTGFGLSSALIEDGLPVGLAHRVPLNRRRWAPDDLALALDEVEYDAAVFSGPDGHGRRTGYLAAVCESFRRAVEMERARWGQARFGPYDGKVRTEGLVDRLREKHGRFVAAVSPSRFETYARCPFEYFLKYVLGIEEVEAPADELELPPRDRGSLLHELLKRLYAERLTGRPLGKLTDEDIGAVLGRAVELLDECGRLYAESHPATWRAERDRIVMRLKALLNYERSRHPAAAPKQFECEFGMTGPPAYVLELGRGDAVSFRGRIDRIDALAEGAIQVVDYKTGKSSGYRANRFAGGTQLQLPIYLLAACELAAACEGSALYLMVGEPKDVPQFTRAGLEERMGEFREAVGLIMRGIASGDFYPLPAAGARDYCERYCPFRSACGAARSYLAEIKQGDPDARALARLRAID